MDVIIIIFLVILSWALGFFCFEKTNIKFESLVEEFVFSSTLGLGILGFFVLLIGLASFLYKWVLISLILVLAFLLSAHLKIIFIRLTQLRFNIKGLSLFSKLLALLFIFCLLFTFIGTLCPPIGNDALSHHLVLPKTFVENGKISYIPHSRASLWPNLTEMLFTLGMALHGDMLAKLFSFSVTLLLVCAIFSFCKRFFSSEVGFFAGVLFFTTPVVFQQTTFAYNDLTLALFSFLTFYGLFLFYSLKQLKWIVLAGVFSGFCMSTKYTGMQIPLIVGLIILFMILRAEDRLKAIKAFCIFSSLTLIVSGVWYLRSYLILDNPVYPFAEGLFGAGYPSHIRGREGAGMGISLTKFIMFPWNITMYPREFGGEILGPVYLSFIPGIFLRRNDKGVIKVLFAIVVGYVILWFFTVQIVRFFLPCLGFVAILVALIFVGMEKRNIKIFLTSALIVLLGFNTTLCAHYNRDAFKLKVGMMSEEEYLEKNERSYKVYKYVNDKLPKSSIILSVGEPRSYYCDRGFIYEYNLRHDTHYYEKVKDPDELVRFLKSKGITHILSWRYLDSKESRLSGNLTAKVLTDNEDLTRKYLIQIFNYTYTHKSHFPSAYTLYELI
tara:strand:+ start:1608 stop:3440 length:1833 start_codon:yes stop_codon:yes gene_type:complete